LSGLDLSHKIKGKVEAEWKHIKVLVGVGQKAPSFARDTTFPSLSLSLTHTHTHTLSLIQIYPYTHIHALLSHSLFCFVLKCALKAICTFMEWQTDTKEFLIARVVVVVVAVVVVVVGCLYSRKMYLLLLLLRM
jgi:hypothetical protein